MKVRTLESETRMRYLLGNNPMGELVKVVSAAYKVRENRKQKVTV
jgi:hypothetical protein